MDTKLNKIAKENIHKLIIKNNSKTTGFYFAPDKPLPERIHRQNVLKNGKELNVKQKDVQILDMKLNRISKENVHKPHIWQLTLKTDDFIIALQTNFMSEYI